MRDVTISPMVLFALIAILPRSIAWEFFFASDFAKYRSLNGFDLFGS